MPSDQRLSLSSASRSTLTGCGKLVLSLSELKDDLYVGGRKSHLQRDTRRGSVCASRVAFGECLKRFGMKGGGGVLPFWVSGPAVCPFLGCFGLGVSPARGCCSLAGVVRALPLFVCPALFRFPSVFTATLHFALPIPAEPIRTISGFFWELSCRFEFEFRRRENHIF